MFRISKKKNIYTPEWDQFTLSVAYFYRESIQTCPVAYVNMIEPSDSIIQM